MATHDGERFVRRQLETIIPQLGADDELVVSDDASTDTTLEIVRSFADSRVRIVEGTFGSAARNFEHALIHATGDIVVLSDQDDIWLEGKLALVRELFGDEQRRPYCVVLDAEVVDENEAPLDPSVLDKLGAGPGFLRNLWTNRYLGCCMAFSRDLLDTALPFPADVPMHDMWLGQLCERVGTTRFVHVVTMRYRRHADTATGFEIRFEPVQQVLRRYRLTRSIVSRSLRARRQRAVHA